MVTPTKGRIVYFTPAIHDPNISRDGAPYAALVTHAYGNNYGKDPHAVNVTVFGPRGQYLAYKVPLVQEGDKPVNMLGQFVEWMPFQKGQTTASDAVQARLQRLEEMMTSLQQQRDIGDALLVGNEAFRRQPEPAPPVDNAHVAAGCEQFKAIVGYAPMKGGSYQGSAVDNAAKATTPPKVTNEGIEKLIVGEFYIGGRDIVDQAESLRYKLNEQSKAMQSLGVLTICTLVLKNGFTVIGKSACVSPAIFNAELGRKYAREDAVRQIWALEGYLLKQKLCDTEG